MRMAPKSVVPCWNGALELEADMAQLLADVDDATLKELLMNLGGHDISQILQAFATAAKVEDRPVAIMAYTIKGWGLPIAGHIDNHAAQLTQAHIVAMQERLGIAVGHEWDGYDAADPIAQWIQQMQHQLMLSQPLRPSLIRDTAPFART